MASKKSVLCEFPDVLCRPIADLVDGYRGRTDHLTQLVQEVLLDRFAVGEVVEAAAADADPDVDVLVATPAGGGGGSDGSGSASLYFVESAVGPWGIEQMADTHMLSLEGQPSFYKAGGYAGYHSGFVFKSGLYGVG